MILKCSPLKPQGSGSLSKGSTSPRKLPGRLIRNGRDAAVQFLYINGELLVVSVRAVLQITQRHRLAQAN
jgi:hypothetical protein